MLNLKTKPKVGPTFRLLTEEFPLMPITQANQYDGALTVIEQLMEKLVMEKFKGTEAAEVNQYLTVLADLVSKYENKRFVRGKVSGIEVLRTLMETKGLTQGDIPEIGQQPHVSEVLRGKRPISWAQAVKLGARFKVEPAIFMDTTT